MKMIYLDIRKTGLDCVKDQVIEVAMIKGNVKNHFYVKLEGRILPAQVIESTGITKRDLSNGLSLQEAMKTLKDAVGDDTVVVYNARDFGFLNIQPNFYDLRSLTYVLRPRAKLDFESIAGEFNVEAPKTALFGVDAVKVIFDNYHKQLTDMGIVIFKNKLLRMPERPERHTPPNAIIM